MRIDSHVHGNVSDLEIPTEEYIAQCQEKGVDGVVHISSPERVFESKRKDPPLREDSF